MLSRSLHRYRPRLRPSSTMSTRDLSPRLPKCSEAPHRLSKRSNLRLCALAATAVNFVLSPSLATANAAFVTCSASACRSSTSTESSSSFRSERLFSTSSAVASVAESVVLQHSDFYVPSENTANMDNPVVFLHGLLGNRRNFATIGRSLGHQLEKQRRIASVDLRNHGESVHAENHARNMHYSDMAADVIDFLDRQEMEQAVLVGHSMGAKVAQAVALLEPARVEGLVVLDMAPVRYTEQDANWKAVVDIMQVLNQAKAGMTKKQVDAHLQSSIPDPALRAFVLTNWDVSKADWKIPIADIHRQMDKLADFDFCPDAHQYDGDVFMIHGGQSRFVRHAYMERIGQYFPNHLLTTVKGVGHWVHAEAPEDTTALLKQYLDR